MGMQSDLRYINSLVASASDLCSASQDESEIVGYSPVLYSMDVLPSVNT